MQMAANMRAGPKGPSAVAAQRTSRRALRVSATLAPPAPSASQAGLNGKGLAYDRPLVEADPEVASLIKHEKGRQVRWQLCGGLVAWRFGGGKAAIGAIVAICTPRSQMLAAPRRMPPLRRFVAWSSLHRRTSQALRWVGAPRCGFGFDFSAPVGAARSLECRNAAASARYGFTRLSFSRICEQLGRWTGWVPGGVHFDLRHVHLQQAAHCVAAHDGLAIHARCTQHTSPHERCHQCVGHASAGLVHDQQVL